MSKQVSTPTLFVGVDVHRDSHTAVALSPLGEKIFEMKINNQEPGFTSLVNRSHQEARQRKLTPTFGLEDVHSWGEHLSSWLVEANLPVVSVAPILVDRTRQNTTHPEKNDSLDAHGVAEVMIKKIDTLPVYNITKAGRLAKHIRELSHDREWLVDERTRLKNQLHALLYRTHNSQYKERFKDPFAQKALRYWLRSKPKGADPIVLRRLQRSVRRINALRLEIKELEEELAFLIDSGDYTLTTASGCGTIVAGEIIGEIGDINRFRTPGALAKYAGCSPCEYSSGQTKRWRKTRSGNRRLNRAFYRMALAQISRSGNLAARTYYQRKIQEGKTRAQALVCLRRQLVNVVWMMLKHQTEYRYPQERS